MIERFLHGVALSLDYAVELLFEWRRSVPMTISSRCGLALRRGEKRTPMALLGKCLNWLSKGHCEGAIKADIERCTWALQQLR